MSNDLNPYASPQTTDSTPDYSPKVSTPPAARYPYVSAHGRAMVAVVMVCVVMLMAGLTIVSSFMQLSLLEEARSGQAIEPADAEANDVRHGLIAVATLLATIVSGITFLMWLHRAHRNLPALRAGKLEYTPGWAVGFWFVPFLNLVRPCQVMFEVQRESDPARVAPLSSPKSAAIIGFWWAAWLTSGVLAQISFRVAINSEDINSLIGCTWLDIVSDFVVIAAGLMIVVIIRSIDSCQTERHQKLAAAGEYQAEWVPPGFE